MSVCLLAECVLSEASTAEDVAAVRRLFRNYADWLAVDLCFQGFECELAELNDHRRAPVGFEHGRPRGLRASDPRTGT